MPPDQKMAEAVLVGGIVALAGALMSVRHGDVEPPLTEPCQVCKVDAAKMMGVLRAHGWHILPAQRDQR